MNCFAFGCNVDTLEHSPKSAHCSEINTKTRAVKQVAHVAVAHSGDTIVGKFSIARPAAAGGMRATPATDVYIQCLAFRLHYWAVLLGRLGVQDIDDRPPRAGIMFAVFVRGVHHAAVYLCLTVRHSLPALNVDNWQLHARVMRETPIMYTHRAVHCMLFAVLSHLAARDSVARSRCAGPV